MTKAPPALPHEIKASGEQFPGVYVEATIIVSGGAGDLQSDGAGVYSHLQLLAGDSSHSSSGIRHHLDVYTNQPEILARFYREGLSALDGVGERQILMFTEDRSRGGDTTYLQGSRFDVTDGILTIDQATLVLDKAQKDKLNALPYQNNHGEGGAGRHGTRPLWDMIMRQLDGSYFHPRYNEQPNYQRFPAVAAVYKDIGVKTHPFGSRQQVPTPQGFRQRLQSLRERAEQNGDTSLTYYPDVELLAYGEIPPRLYLEAYARGRHPVGTSDAYHYAHDILDNHFQAFLVYGEPFMELVQFTATDALQRADAADTPEESTRIIGAAVGAIDNLSAGFGSKSVMDAAWEFNEVTTRQYELLVASIKPSEDFKNLQVVRSLFERKIVKNVKDITFEHIASEMKFLARIELGVSDQQTVKATRISQLLRKMSR